MKVRILDESGDEVWSHESVGGQTSGTTSRRYLSDSTQQRIIDALLAALIEARGQLGRTLHVADVVSDIRLSPAKVDDGVPVA